MDVNPYESPRFACEQVQAPQAEDDYFVAKLFFLSLAAMLSAIAFTILAEALR